LNHQTKKIKDVVTLAEFKSRAATLLERLRSSSQPLLITQNGKPAGVLLPPAEFDRIQEQETSRFVLSINQGMNDADAGKILNTQQAKSRLGVRK